MQVDWTGWLALLSALALLAIMLFTFLRRRNKRPAARATVVSQPQVKTPEKNIPERIAFGATPAQPLVTVALLTSAQEYEMARPLDAQSGAYTSISRLSALCGTLPSLLVAGGASGRHLMEVVIHGDLVRAADGNGLRAFAMNGNRIGQNARLYEVSILPNVINAAAIWHIASVLVAQKYLADISNKLDEIKDGILGISRFLDNQRKARLRATYDYLAQVYQAIQGGDLPGAARNQLEQCERDLLEIQHHLETEYREKVAKQIKDKEWFGTAGLAADIGSKLDELDMLAEDIAFCLKTRIAACHVLSLFPGEQQLKLARRESIKKSVESFQALGPYCEEKLKHEIAKINAFFVREAALIKQRTILADKCDLALQTLAQKSQQSREALERSERLMLENDRPTRILFRFENGALVGARQG